MNKEAIQKLGEKIGTVKEVETDEAGECIGQFEIKATLNFYYYLHCYHRLQPSALPIQKKKIKKLYNFCQPTIIIN